MMKFDLTKLDNFIDKKMLITQIIAQVISITVIAAMYYVYLYFKRKNLTVNFEKLNNKPQETIYLPEDTKKEIDNLLQDFVVNSSNRDTNVFWEFNGPGGTGKTALLSQIARKYKNVEVWKCNVSDIFEAGLDPFTVMQEEKPIEKRLKILLQKAESRAKKGKKVIVMLDEFQRYLTSDSVDEVSKFINTYFGNEISVNLNIQFVCCTNTPIKDVMNINSLNMAAHTRKVKEIDFTQMDGYAFLHWLCDKTNSSRSDNKLDYNQLWKNGTTKDAANNFIKYLYEQLLESTIKRYENN